MNKSEMSEKLAARAGLTKLKAAGLIDMLFGEGGIIASELAAGQKVQIHGFGTFERRQRNARTAHNPQDGSLIEIPAKKVPAFKPGKALADRIAASK